MGLRQPAGPHPTPQGPRSQAGWAYHGPAFRLWLSEPARHPPRKGQPPPQQGEAMRSPLSLALLASRVDTTGGSAVTSCGGRAVPPRLGPVTSMLRASAQGQGVGAGPRVTRSPFWPPLDPQNGTSASAEARPLLAQRTVAGSGPWGLSRTSWHGGRAGRQWEGGEVELGKCLFWNQMIKLVPESP